MPREQKVDQDDIKVRGRGFIATRYLWVVVHRPRRL